MNLAAFDSSEMPQVDYRTPCCVFLADDVRIRIVLVLLAFDVILDVFYVFSIAIAFPYV